MPWHRRSPPRGRGACLEQTAAAPPQILCVGAPRRAFWCCRAARPIS